MSNNTVVYSILENGVLVDKTKKFDKETDMFLFIKQLKKLPNLVGKPIIWC